MGEWINDDRHGIGHIQPTSLDHLQQTPTLEHFPNPAASPALPTPGLHTVQPHRGSPGRTATRPHTLRAPQAADGPLPWAGFGGSGLEGPVSANTCLGGGGWMWRWGGKCA